MHPFHSLILMGGAYLLAKLAKIYSPTLARFNFLSLMVFGLFLEVVAILLIAAVKGHR